MWVILFYVLLFLPSINFGVTTSEIFPWVLIFFLRNGLVLDKRSFYFILVLFLFSCHALILGFDYGFANSDFVRSFAAYVIPIIGYSFTKGMSKNEVNKIVKVTKNLTVFLVILAVFQSTGLINFLQPIFDFLLNRGGADSLTNGRGVSLMSSEPSRASYELIFMFSLCRLFYKNKVKNILLVDLILSIIVLFFIRSAVGACFLILYLFLNNKKIFILFSTLLSLLLSFFTFNSRALTLLIIFLSETDPTIVFNLILSQSGFRLISIISSVKSGITDLFGRGIGFWKVSSVDALYATKIPVKVVPYFINGYYTPIRSTSYFSSLMLDVGIIGGILFTVLLITPIFRGLNSNTETKPILYLFLFYIYLYGSIGNPIPWLVVGIALTYNKINRSLNNSI